MVLYRTMIYTIKERNNALISVAKGKADLTNVEFFERLESFNWVYLQKVNGAINTIELTYAGQNLLNRLSKQNDW